MDNSFYEQKRDSREREKNKKTAENNTAIKILAIQMSLALLITGFLYLVCRNNGDLSKNIKALYSTACEKDVSASEMLDVFKKVSQMTFAPSKTSADDSTAETLPETVRLPETEETTSDEAEI